MDFVFGFPEDTHKNKGILVFVDRFSKMVHLVAVLKSITAEDCACVFVDTIFRLHGLYREMVPTEIRGLPQSSGSPCSVLSENV